MFTPTKKNEIYIGGAYKGINGLFHPLLIKLNLDETNQMIIQWSNAYFNLRVDDVTLRNRIKGIKIPIVNTFKTFGMPGFFARDLEGNNLVLTLFSTNTGKPFNHIGIKYNLPNDVVLIDAVRQYNAKNSFMVLFNKRELNSNVVNTTSYIFNVDNFISSTPTWYDMVSPDEIVTALARKFIHNTDKKVAIGLLGNTTQFGWNYDITRSTLFTSDDFEFNCLEKEDLEMFSLIKNSETHIILNPFFKAPSSENRIIYRSSPLEKTEEEICMRDNNPNHSSLIDTKNYQSKNSSTLIYPNPARDLINIELPKQTLEGNSYVRITDMTGTSVFSKELDSSVQTIRIDDLASGMYIIILENGKGILHYQKITKL